MNTEQINAELATHRVWSLIVAGGPTMAAITPRLEDVEGQGVCLVFSDGARWRNPRAASPRAEVGLVELQLPDWADKSPVAMRPLTMQHAQELDLPDVAGLDPADEAHQVIFESMFPG